MASVKFRLERRLALGIIEYCGWKTASNWDNPRLATKLSQVREVTDDFDPPDAEVRAAMQELLVALDDGSDIEVYQAAEAGQTSPTVGKDKAPVAAKQTAKQPAKQTAAKTQQTSPAHENQEPAKSPPKAEKQQPKQQKVEKAPQQQPEPDPIPDEIEVVEVVEAAVEEAPAIEQLTLPSVEKEPVVAKLATKKVRPAGIRPTCGRVYIAAQVLRKHGLEKGITDEMVAEVDRLSGRPNLRESRSWLAMTWQAVNGFTEKFPVKSKIEERVAS